jgi:drug/metabolite transporter (DMT)-like permease
MEKVALLPTVVPASAPSATLWFVALTVVSVIMTVGNKLVMLDFHHPNLVMGMQNATCVIMLVVGSSMKLLDIKPISGEQWKIFSVCAIMLVCQIISMLYALPLVAIATTVVFRNAATVAIAFIDWAFFGKKFTMSTVSGLVLATAGMTIYAINDVSFDAVGYFWLSVNAAATVVNTFWNNVYVKEFKKKKQQTPFGVSLVQQVETLPIIICLVASEGDFAAAPLILDLSMSTQFVLLCTCIGGMAISVVYMQLFSLSSGTSIVLASTMNKAISILVAHYLFHDVLTSQQIVGLLICITGGVWYSIAPSGALDSVNSRCWLLAARRLADESSGRRVRKATDRDLAV